MTTTVLYDDGVHRNLMMTGFEEGGSVPANQHLIVHGDEAMILDPGGHKVYSKVLGETLSLLGSAKLTKLFLSHQDPDVVAATNGWLMTTDAIAYASELWVRFIPHFGLDRLVADRLLPIPDAGQRLDLGGCQLWVLPAHFLHSCGNFQVYDPISRILYSGDLGASVGLDYLEVTSFEGHAGSMAGFHRRYMANNATLQAWARMVRQLDVEVIAPQHGAFFRGKEMVEQFVGWCEQLRCGTDLITDLFQAPS